MDIHQGERMSSPIGTGWPAIAIVIVDTRDDRARSIRDRNRFASVVERRRGAPVADDVVDGMKSAQQIHVRRDDQVRTPGKQSPFRKSIVHALRKEVSTQVERSRVLVVDLNELGSPRDLAGAAGMVMDLRDDERLRQRTQHAEPGHTAHDRSERTDACRVEDAHSHLQA